MIFVLERLLDDGTWHPDEMALSSAGAMAKWNIKRLMYPNETHRVITYYTQEERCEV